MWLQTGIQAGTWITSLVHWMVEPYSVLEKVGRGVGLAQWREHSLPTNVTWIRFQDPPSYVGWVCCWFSSLLRGFFSGFSSFPSSTKTNTSKFQFDWGILRATGLSVARLLSVSLVKEVDLFIYLFLNFHALKAYLEGLMVIISAMDFGSDGPFSSHGRGTALCSRQK